MNAKLRDRLVDEFGEGWADGHIGIDTSCCHVREGEHCDGEPSWEIWENYDEVQIEYTCGWYAQRGEASTIDDAIMVMYAMEAAGAAFDAAIYEARKAERDTGGEAKP